MTVLIASLFLPYTVKFEVDSVAEGLAGQSDVPKYSSEASGVSGGSAGATTSATTAPVPIPSDLPVSRGVRAVSQELPESVKNAAPSRPLLRHSASTGIYPMQPIPTSRPGYGSKPWRIPETTILPSDSAAAATPSPPQSTLRHPGDLSLSTEEFFKLGGPESPDRGIDDSLYAGSDPNTPVLEYSHGGFSEPGGAAGGAEPKSTASTTSASASASTSAPGLGIAHELLLRHNRTSHHLIQPPSRAAASPFAKSLVDRRTSVGTASPSLRMLPGRSESFANLRTAGRKATEGATPIYAEGHRCRSVGNLRSLATVSSAEISTDYMDRGDSYLPGSGAAGDDETNEEDKAGFGEEFGPGEADSATGIREITRMGGVGSSRSATGVAGLGIRGKASGITPNIGSDVNSELGIFSSAPWTIQRFSKGNGGLYNAVGRAVAEGFLSARTWIGTPGTPTDALPSATRSAIADKLAAQFDCQCVLPSDTTFENAYSHFCKEILWPTLHYQIPDHPKSKAYEDHSWEHYRALNQLFADKIVETYREGDVVWVHDYHLMLVPQMVREKLPKAAIGFFLHVAFPSSEVFRCFAARGRLLAGMLGADCVVFQTEEYARHFLQTCNRLLMIDVAPGGAVVDGRFVAVRHSAIGIDVPRVEALLESEDVARWRKLIRERFGDKKLIVGRDKLDRIRGVRYKLLGYERFLRDHPEWRSKVVLLQVCLKSSAAATGDGSGPEADITRIVERINAMCDGITAAPQPVVFLHQDISFAQYVALLAEADVFTVASLREGMNLTCHEYVCCTRERHSPLVLSEFTGSASVLEGALLVNPWDRQQVADALLQALTMPEAERAERWRTLHSIVTGHGGAAWVKQCLAFVQAAWEEQRLRDASHAVRLALRPLREKYQEIGRLSRVNHRMPIRRVFFLNVEARAVPAEARTARVARVVPISTQRAVSILADLAADPGNVVYLISSLRRVELERLYRRAPGVGLIAESGAYIRPAGIGMSGATTGGSAGGAVGRNEVESGVGSGAVSGSGSGSGSGAATSTAIGSDTWLSIVDPASVAQWKPAVLKMMQSLVERLPGSYVESLESTVKFYTGPAEDAERAKAAAGECIVHVNELFGPQGVHATLVDDVVVVHDKVDLELRAVRLAISMLRTGCVYTVEGSRVVGDDGCVGSGIGSGSGDLTGVIGGSADRRGSGIVTGGVAGGGAAGEDTNGYNSGSASSAASATAGSGGNTGGADATIGSGSVGGAVSTNDTNSSSGAANSAPDTPKLERIELGEASEVLFLFVAGGMHPYDESVFEYVNSLATRNRDFAAEPGSNGGEKDVVLPEENVFTVSLQPKPATSAKASLEGVNRLLLMLNSLE